MSKPQQNLTVDMFGCFQINMIIGCLVVLLLTTKSNSMTVDLQQTKVALGLLNHALNVSQTHMNIQLADFDIQHVHLSNSSCSKCGKQFRNSSYLTYHWLSLHAADNRELHVAIHQLCLFASCKEVPKTLRQTERATLCNLFSEKYLEEMKG